MYAHVVLWPISQFPFTTAGFRGKLLQILISTSFKVQDLGIQEIVIVIEIGA